MSIIIYQIIYHRETINTSIRIQVKQEPEVNANEYPSCKKNLHIRSEYTHIHGWTEVPNILQIRFLKKKQRSTSGAHLVWVGISAMLIKLFEHILVISKSSLHIGTTSTIVLSI
jgi:hypothetical protein